MLNAIKNFLKDEEGLSAVEYCIAGGLIVAGLAVSFRTIGASALARLGELDAGLQP